MTNLLVMQSGGSTHVLNRSLQGIVQEAEASGKFGQIMGARHALDGILNDSIVDLGRYDKKWWDRAGMTPGAILGSSRRKIRDGNVSKILDTLKCNDIDHWFMIGGNDSAMTTHRIHQEAKIRGQNLVTVNIPKTIDNDLVMTDHTPGYGSAARFVSLAVMGAGRDAETMGNASPITMIEVMGRDAGWLAAASVLAKRSDRDAPHLICVPEIPIDVDLFVSIIEKSYTNFGFAVGVIAENARGVDGPLGNSKSPYHIDDFGHHYFEGPAKYLATVVENHLGVRVRVEKPGTIQRSMATSVSNTDSLEAEMAGRAAVKYALAGATDQMVTLVRDESEQYSCTTGLAPLGKVAGRVKEMPSSYLDPSNYGVTDDFIRYAQPLIGESLPKFERIHD